ncbi:hypothetical protein L195_g059899, partial [Trifolium pratense]
MAQPQVQVSTTTHRQETATYPPQQHLRKDVYESVNYPDHRPYNDRYKDSGRYDGGITSFFSERGPSAYQILATVGGFFIGG